jgi:hypothetical protein
MCGRAEAAERDLDPRLVVPADVGIQGRHELLDGRAAPVSQAVTRKAPVKKAMATPPAEAPASTAKKTRAKKSTIMKAATVTDAATGATAATTPAQAPDA